MTDTNEIQTAYAIRRELDQGALQLPDRVTSRLAAARRAALAAHPGTVSRPTVHTVRRPAPRPGRGLRATPPFWSRLAVTAVPALAIVFGLVLIGQWSDQRRIEALAEIDTEVLIDDLPIAAYADRGFGVYLRNTRGWSAVPTGHVARGPDR